MSLTEPDPKTLWRCIDVRDGEWIFRSPEGRRFGARIDQGRPDGDMERWLRRLPYSGPDRDFRVFAPRDWYRKENPDGQGRLLAFGVTREIGLPVLWEFHRGLPDASDFIHGYNLSTIDDAKKEIERWHQETTTSLSSLEGLMSRSREARASLSRSRAR